MSNNIILALFHDNHGKYDAEAELLHRGSTARIIVELAGSQKTANPPREKELRPHETEGPTKKKEKTQVKEWRNK